jgi:hypothetical protein
MILTRPSSQSSLAIINLPSPARMHLFLLPFTLVESTLSEEEA